MQRTLTIHFDDNGDSDTIVELATSLAVVTLENCGMTLVETTLEPHESLARWQGGVDYLEWCQTAEANEAPEEVGV